MRTNIPVRELGGSLFQAKGSHRSQASDCEAVILAPTHSRLPDLQVTVPFDHSIFDFCKIR
jgi:hypothetical protein